MGIEIIATLSQKNNGKFPLVDSNDIGGGFYQVDSIEERDLIPDVRRKEGMLCYVKDDKLYQLIGGIGNEYWSIFSSSESDVIKEYVDKQLENKSEKGHTHEEYAEKDSVYTTSEIDEKIAMIPTEVYHVGEMPPTNTDVLWIDNGDETLESIDGTILDEVRFSINNNKTKINELSVKVDDFSTEDNLESENSKKPLSAKQGKVLNNKILNLNKNSHNHTNADILNQISASRVSSWDNKSNFNGNYNSLTNKPQIPTKTSELENDSNFITSDDLGSISGGQQHVHSNLSDLETITSTKINEWDNKSNFSGDYNDLDNKPTIPSIDGLASETYVNEKVADILDSAPETLDTLKELSNALGDDPNFATTISNKIGLKADKTELHSHSNKDVIDNITSAKVNEWNNKSNFSGNYNDLINKPTIPNLEGYATEDFVRNEIGKAQIGGGEVDLTGYALKTELHNHTNKTILDNITSTKISQWDSKSTFSGSYNDLTNKPTIPTKTSQLTNDSNYLTSVPSEYITESELSGKGYLTSIPNTYALKTDIPTIPTSLPANGGNANTVSGYSIWIGTQTQYDAISTKSSTTIYMIRG